MTEQHAHSGAEEPAPPSKAAEDGRAGSPRAEDDGKAGRAPLGEWRGPAFWMACGALLAGLVGATVVLVERVAVERDMMAVAATLPQPGSPAQPTPALRQEGNAVPASIAASEGSQAAPPPASPAARQATARHAAAGDGRPEAAGSVRRHAARRPPAAVAPRLAGAPHATAIKARAKPAQSSRRKRAVAVEAYSDVFKRCPAPGLPGAVQCRRDICNGAEGKGPACKPYVKKPR